jgi:hypothetical protein
LTRQIFRTVADSAVKTLELERTFFVVLRSCNGSSINTISTVLFEISKV